MPLSRRQTALQTPFDPTGLPWTEINVQAALESVRRNVVNTPTDVSTTASGTTTLTIASTTLQLITGTASGHSFVLPNATALFEGRKFEFQNFSSQAVLIKTNGGATIVTLIAGDTALITLRNNTTSVGVWTTVTITSVASGVNAFNVVAATKFSTSSSTDVLITSMSITPPSGTYACWFSSDIVIGSNNRITRCSIYKAGVAVVDSRRTTQGVGSNYESNIHTLAIVNVNGSQSIDIRVNITSGLVDYLGKSFLIVRLGA